MKILIPSDFSKHSKVAVLYAAKLAIKLKAELILLNVLLINTPITAEYIFKGNTGEDSLAESARQNSIQFINEIRDEVKSNLSIRHEIIKGRSVDKVAEDYAKQNHMDMIVIGTKGAKGLSKALIGNITTSVISKSTIPVIAVPEFARFIDLKKIVYATDALNMNEELEAIVPIAKMFNARIHVLHIIPSKSKEKISSKSIVEKLKHIYPEITFHVSINENVLQGIDEYIAAKKADMLVMFTHELTFFDEIFGKSLTRQLAFNTWIPLLTMKKQKI